MTGGRWCSRRPSRGSGLAVNEFPGSRRSQASTSSRCRWRLASTHPISTPRNRSPGFLPMRRTTWSSAAARAWRDRRRVRRSWQRMAGPGGNGGTRRRRSVAARAGAGAAPDRRYHAGSGRAQRRGDGRRRPRLHDGWHRRDSARSHGADYRQDVRRAARPRSDGGESRSLQPSNAALPGCPRSATVMRVRRLAPSRCPFHLQSFSSSHRTAVAAVNGAPAGVAASAVARDVDGRPRRRLDRRGAGSRNRGRHASPAVARPDDPASRRRRAGCGSQHCSRCGTSNGDRVRRAPGYGPGSDREPATESVYSPEHFSFLTHDRVALQGPDTRQVQDHRASRQRRLRYRLPRAGHLDRQEGRDQGAAPAGPRLRRAAARAAAARQRQPSQHRRRSPRRRSRTTSSSS